MVGDITVFDRGLLLLLLGVVHIGQLLLLWGRLNIGQIAGDIQIIKVNHAAEFVQILSEGALLLEKRRRRLRERCIRDLLAGLGVYGKTLSLLKRHQKPNE